MVVSAAVLRHFIPITNETKAQELANGVQGFVCCLLPDIFMAVLTCSFRYLVVSQLAGQNLSNMAQAHLKMDLVGFVVADHVFVGLFALVS